ncbi:MAG TPA: beta-ketoacyl-[acyl-carrier-protein] synthase family protein [Polyangiaceae bacterium]|jgi:3-oxoacyl-[acyl-carrier-protein] synthase II
MTERIAITGLGLVSPLGLDVPAYWKALCEGRSGVSRITEFPTDKLRSDVAATVYGFDPSRWFDKKEQEIYGRVEQLASVAADEAITEADLGRVDPTRVGVLVSTGQGAVEIFEEQIRRSSERGPRAVSPYFIPGVMLNAVAALISVRHGYMGPSFNVASACATANHSIAVSAMMILSGEADVMIAGGAEAATRLNTVAGFGNARALARSFQGDPKRASRPYDMDRFGFVMGEGAGALVLETESHAKKRGVKPIAYLSGWGLTSDAEHITRPHPEGRGLGLAMEAALRRARVAPDEVGYINPHATSTPQGDVAEYVALVKVFGSALRNIPISATKSMIGHLLGAAGAAEAIAVVCSLRDGVLHPSINVDRLDPVFRDIELVRETREVRVKHAISNSAGFGGHNCVLAFEREAS